MICTGKWRRSGRKCQANGFCLNINVFNFLNNFDNPNNIVVSVRHGTGETSLGNSDVPWEILKMLLATPLVAFAMSYAHPFRMFVEWQMIY